jgi:hypothetical protein
VEDHALQLGASELSQEQEQPWRTEQYPSEKSLSWRVIEMVKRWKLAKIMAVTAILGLLVLTGPPRSYAADDHAKCQHRIEKD